MALPSLDGIKERKLVQWGLAYLAGAWLVLQVVAVLGATYGWPSGLLRAVPVVLAVGFLVALVAAWYHGERGAQRASGPEMAILTVLMVIAGVGVMLVGGGAEAGAVDTAIDDDVAPEADQMTIAVLPFENVGGEDYVADGLTDELIQTLSRVPGLQVTARTSAFAFKGSDARADSIGRALGVAHLVEGTVRTVGDQLRVTASLVDAETGRQAWSETYNRALADVLGLQEEIARAIAYQLRARVGSAARVGRPSTDPEAYLLTLRGNAIAHGSLGDDYTESPRIYAEAIARDSSYAPAWAGLASAHQIIVEHGYAEDRDAEWAAARAAAERALVLDPREALAHIVLGRLAYAYDGNLAAAQAHYERAVEANPSHTFALAMLGFTRQFWGDEEGALRAVEQAVARDPLAEWSLLLSGLVYLSAGKTERGLELGRAAYALNANSVTATWLAEFLAVAGHDDEAIALLRPYVEERPSFQFGQQVLAYAYARTGDRRRAERHLSHITDPHTARAWVEVAFGDADATFAALERSVAASEPYMEDLVVSPVFIPLHEDPRWAGLVARVRAGAGQR